MLRNRWLNSVLNQGQTSAKTKLTSQLASHFAQFGQQASQIGIVVYGVFLISSGNLTMGQLIACVILSGRTMAPLGQITGLLGRMNQARSAYRGLNEVLGVTTEEEERADFVKRPNLKGDLSLKGVNFTYEDQPDPMLQNISLDIQAGQKIAILGRIGSGKTTLLRLICGLQAPDTGAVLLDNADIRQIRPQDVRKNIGVVLQNPILFSGTIRDNLLMGKPEATDEELIDAARIAGADSFIGMLPGGFDFPLSERGQELSSGMRQSIAIARAVISKPNILVMDEPTASMDNATEAQLVDRLMESMTDTTCLFVTHRGAMLKMADHVVVMEKGQIAMAAPESVAKETNLFHQRNIAFQEQESVLRQSIAEIEGNIAEKMAEADISDQQYLIRKSEYDLIKPLVDAGHESKLSLIEAETRWRQAKGAAELARLSVKAMSARQIGLQREISLLSSQRRAEASQLLVESQTSLEQAKARKKSLQERVAYADIRAPETGTISALHIKTIGAVVQAGSQLAEIVPANSEHVVRARLLPQDVADVTLGQLARVSLSAYDVSRYGSLEGEVIHVASNTTEEPDIPPYYETMIALTQKSFPNIDLTPEIVPGMQVTVDIIGGKRTVLEYILSPIEKATSVAFREK